MTTKGGKDRRLLQRLREDLDWIVLRAVATDREQRYSSVAALADDVERHLRGEPVLARQRASAYVVRKFVQRNRLAVAVGLLVIASLIASIASLSWGLDVAEDARSQAERDRDVARSRERTARMAVAQLALSSGDVQTARSNLAAVPTDYRGWEWRHLAAQSNTSLSSFAIGKDSLAIRWLDERHLATFQLFEAPAVYDATTGERLRQFEWSGVFRRLGFDERTGRAVLAGDDGVGIWDCATGKRVRRFGRAAGEVLSLAWSEDRKALAFGSRGNRIETIDVVTGEYRSLPMPRDVTAIAFADDKRLVAGCVDGSMFVVSRAAARSHDNSTDIATKSRSHWPTHDDTAPTRRRSTAPCASGT